MPPSASIRSISGRADWKDPTSDVGHGKEEPLAKSQRSTLSVKNADRRMQPKINRAVCWCQSNEECWIAPVEAAGWDSLLYSRPAVSTCLRARERAGIGEPSMAASNSRPFLSLEADDRFELSVGDQIGGRRALRSTAFWIGRSVYRRWKMRLRIKVPRGCAPPNSKYSLIHTLQVRIGDCRSSTTQTCNRQESQA